MIVAAHGIHLELPRGWSGRLFSRGPGVATLHAGDFPLVLRDGEFGDRSTGRMPHPGVFVALTEYRPGAGLEAGRGLFAARKPPVPLDPGGFAASRLAHPRPRQAGSQHFFTLSGRPFCVYVVVAGDRLDRRRRVLSVDHALRSLRVAPRG